MAWVPAFDALLKLAPAASDDEQRRLWLRVLADSVGAMDAFIVGRCDEHVVVLGSSRLMPAESAYRRADAQRGDGASFTPVPLYRMARLADTLDPVTRLLDRHCRLMEQGAAFEGAFAVFDAVAAKSITRFYFAAQEPERGMTANLMLAARLAHQMIGAHPELAPAAQLGPIPVSAADAELTAEQLLILQHAFSGRTNQQIGVDLGRSRQAIERMFTVIRRLLGARSRSEAITIAHRDRLIDLPLVLP